MHSPAIQETLREGYENALACLAIEYRSLTPGQEERERLIISTYNNILHFLLDLGFSSVLDPDTELPDEVLSKRYLTHRLNIR